MKTVLVSALIIILSLPFFALALDIGDPAPDFTLPDVQTKKQVSLSTFRGQVVVLQLMKCQ